MDNRKPAMIFFDDPASMKELKSARIREIFRTEIKGEYDDDHVINDESQF